MKRLLLILQITLIVSLATGQTFQDMLNRINNLPEPDRQPVVDSFMNSGHTFPYIESDTVTHFIFRGPALNIKVAGDATEWNPQLIMIKISGTDFWYHTISYPADARLDYKFVMNGSDWILDPLNSHTCAGGFGPNSELRMPSCEVPPELSFYPDITHGTIKDTTFRSEVLGNSRTIKIYLPPGYNTSAGDYPVILFHDGLEYISLAKANNILDYLIAHQKIVPVIGIFVPPVDRTAEYAGNKMDRFTALIVDELMPVIDNKFRTSKDSKKRAMMGASNGGNISLYIGLKHPEVFGKIAAQSSNVISEITTTLRDGKKVDIEFYVDVGAYDIGELIPLVQGLVNILQVRDYPFRFYKWNEGHSWGNWEGHLRYPLIQFFNMNIIK